MSDMSAGLWQHMSLIVDGNKLCVMRNWFDRRIDFGRFLVMQCPFCGSTHLQRYSVVRAQGTVRVEAEHIGVNGPFVARSEGIAYTDAARNCAPPAPPTPLPFLIAFLFGGFAIHEYAFAHSYIVWQGVWLGIGILGVGWLLFLGYRHSARQFRRAKAEWLRTWLCFSCGGSCRTEN
jgi:hypothetical protein